MDTLQTGLVGQLLLPIDWVYLPIIELYNAVVQMWVYLMAKYHFI